MEIFVNGMVLDVHKDNVLINNSTQTKNVKHILINAKQMGSNVLIYLKIVMNLKDNYHFVNLF